MNKLINSLSFPVILIFNSIRELFPLSVGGVQFSILHESVFYNTAPESLNDPRFFPKGHSGSQINVLDPPRSLIFRGQSV